MLLRDGTAVTYSDDDEFARNRHPRTGVCVAPGRTIDLMVVDGRTPEAAGLSLPELAAVMRALGCTTAMNLDGGGSSTMWIRGKRPMGVVSHPSDDRRFDVFGERAVGTAVIVIAPDVIVSGLDEATITTSSSVESGPSRTAGTTEARWELPVFFSGVYKVFVRPVATRAAGARLEIEVDKKPAAIDLTGRTAGWIEVGSTTVTVRDGLVPAPVWLPIVIRSTSGALAVDAVRLVQQP
jgi:hypothetical protein